MAVTYPVVWPDFSTANLTDWVPVRALLDAIRERAVLLAGVHLPERNSTSSFPMSSIPTAMRLDVPTMDVLVGIRTAICQLARFYVNPADEEWEWSGFAGEPPAFGFSAPVRVGDAHSLAELPRVGACEADANALRAYRTFLANAAWWIEKFRYVDACERSLFEAKLTSETNEGSWSDVEDALADPTVDTPAGGFVLRGLNRLGYPDSTRFRFAVDQKIYRGIDMNDTYPCSSLPHPDDWTFRNRLVGHSVYATGYVGLRTANPTPVNADVVLLPFQEKFPWHQVRARMTGTIEFDGDDQGQGHYNLRSYEESFRYEQWFGSGFKPTSTSVRAVTISANNRLSPSTYSETDMQWHHSPDGLVSTKETSTAAGDGTENNRCAYQKAFRDESLKTFDSFGRDFELGTPLRSAVFVPARSERAIPEWPATGVLPVAEGWANVPADAEELHAPGPQQRSFEYLLMASLGLFVLLDFGPYFAFGRST